MSASRDPARAALIQDVFQQYLDAMLGFLGVLTQCAGKSWPDRRDALRRSFDLQKLYYQQQSLRLSYLVETSAPDDPTWNSYSKIAQIYERLEPNWPDNDEAPLVARSPAYAGLRNEIEQLKAMRDDPGLEPYRMAYTDPEFLAAVSDLQKKMQEFDAR